jgi:hypothetical protein
VSSVVDRGVPANGTMVTELAPRRTLPGFGLPERPGPGRWLGRRLGRRSGRRLGRRWGDPLLVGVVALVIYALHGYQGIVDRDLGVFLYGGEHVARGVPPYVAIFNSVGPLADAVPGLAIWLGHFVGVDPLLSARLLFTLLSAICCSLLCVLARDTFGSRAAGFVAPAVFLTFERFLELASDGPREKTTMLVFLLAALILVGRRHWLAAGVCAALATLAWQPAILVALAAVVASVLVDRRDRRRTVAGFLAGGAIPSVAAVLFFLIAGALQPAVQGFVVINVRYTNQPSAITSPITTWHILWTAYHLTLLVALAGLLAMIVLAVRAVPFVRRSAPTNTLVAQRLVVMGTGAAVATAWTIAVVNGGPDLFVVLPFAALGVTGTVLLLASRVPRRLGVWVAVVAVVAGVTVAGVESVRTRSYDLVQQRADIRAVLATQPADATILSVDAPQVLALAGRDNPTRYQLFSSAMESYLDHTRPGGVRSYAAHVRRLRPTFIVIGTSYQGYWPYRVLDHLYWRIGRGTNWNWYLSRRAGVGALLRAREANASAMAGGTNDLSVARAPGRVRPRD